MNKYLWTIFYPTCINKSFCQQERMRKLVRCFSTKVVEPTSKRVIDSTMAYLQQSLTNSHANRNQYAGIANDAFASPIFSGQLASLDKEPALYESQFYLQKLQRMFESEKMIKLEQAQPQPMMIIPLDQEIMVVRAFLLYANYMIKANILKSAKSALMNVSGLVMNILAKYFTEAFTKQAHVTSMQVDLLQQVFFPFMDCLMLIKQYTMVDMICQALLDQIKVGSILVPSTSAHVAQHTHDFVVLVASRIVQYLNQLFWVAGEHEMQFRTKMETISALLNLSMFHIKQTHEKSHTKQEHAHQLNTLHFRCHVSFALFHVLKGNHEVAEKMLNQVIQDTVHLMEHQLYTMQQLTYTVQAFATLRHLLLQLNRKLDFEAKLNTFLATIKTHVNDAIYERFALLHAEILERDQRYDAMENELTQALQALQQLPLQSLDDDSKMFFISGLVEGTILLARSKIYQVQQEQSHSFDAPKLSALQLMNFSLAMDYAMMIPQSQSSLPNYYILFTYYARALYEHTISQSNFELAEQEMIHIDKVLETKHELKQSLRETNLTALQLLLLNYQDLYDTKRKYVPHDSESLSSDDLLGPSPLQLVIQLQQSIFILRQERFIDAMEICKQSHKKLTAKFSSDSPLMVDVNTIYGDAISKSSKDAKKPAPVTSMAERYFRKSTAISEKLGLQASNTRYANLQGMIPLLMMQCAIK